MARTINQLFAKTPIDRRKLGSTHCFFAKKRPRYICQIDGTLRLRANIFSTLPNNSHRVEDVYDVWVQALKSGTDRIYKSMYVKVSCSCPDFMYRWEYALWEAGAADIIYGNGQPPVDTNAARVAGVCKHLIFLLTTVKKRKW